MHAVVSSHVSAHLSRRWVGLLAVLALTLSGLVMAPPQAVAAAHAITEGTVTWGFKKSWRDYIGSSGTTLEGGVTRNSAGTLEWPVTSGTFDDATSSLRLNLAGSAHFQSHRNAEGSFVLDSRFEDLYVVISPTEYTIRGTYSGNPREGGEREEFEDALLATIDIGSADFASAAGTTTWDGAKTFGGPQNGLYAEGTPFDPVSIEYTGPGGIPTAAEAFEEQGAPVLTPGATWMDDSTTEDGRIVFASAEHDVVHVVQRSGFGTADAKYVLRAIDATTMQQLGSTEIEAADARQWFKATFDPATDSIFLADGDPASTGAQIRRATYDPQLHTYGNQVIADIAPIDTSASNNITNLTWNAQKGEAIVVMSRTVSADRRFQGQVSFLAPASEGEGWDAETHAISLPDAAPVTGTLTQANATGTSKTDASGSKIVPLRDGSYLVLHGGSYRKSGSTQPYATPAMHMKRSAGEITLAYVEGTDPAPASAVVASNFDGATTAADGSVVLYGQGEQYVDIVDGEAQAVTGQLRDSGINNYGHAVSDPVRGVDYVMYGQVTTLTARVDKAFVRSYQFDHLNRGGLTGHYPAAVLPDGAVTLVVKDPETGNIGLRRFDLLGVTPKVTGQPAAQSVSLAPGVASEDVTFSSTIEGGSGEIVRKWQAKAPGQSTYTDLAGESGETLTIAAKPGMGGTKYRALYSNQAGTVASEAATLAVDYAPVIVSDARDQSVTEGADAVFVTSFDAEPEASYTWQRRVNGFWTDIASGDDLTVNGPALTIESTNVDQSGTQVRVKASNEVGTTVSRSARLTVNPKVAIPAGGLDLDGVTLEWTGSAELQHAPPFGGSNFFSAGVSDGSEGTYKSAEGAVSVVHVDDDGGRSPATWTTRAAPVSGDVTQHIQLADGQAHLGQDGAVTVAWDGAWSVNAYGGMVPFTISDPVLHVDADGVGTLRADLSGYASTQEDPNTRTPMDPVPDVTVGTFRDVTIDPAGRISIEPDYDGVEVDVPATSTAQVRTMPGWGAWPQQFVDFHIATGLSSYWYSSGGAADPLKAAAPFTVDFTDAEPATPHTEVSSTTSVSLDRSSHAYGSRTTATVTVAASGASPSGTVSVTVAGKTLTGALVNGTARVPLTKGLKPGSYRIEVAYPGAAGITASSARATLRVTKAVPTISAKLARTSIKASQRPKITVRVTIPGGSSLRPTGQLVIRDGNRTVAVRTLRSGHRGKLTIRLPKTSRGKHYLRASIVGTPLLTSRTSTYRTIRVR